jgi:hypothetical protein
VSNSGQGMTICLSWDIFLLPAQNTLNQNTYMYPLVAVFRQHAFHPLQCLPLNTSISSPYPPSTTMRLDVLAVAAAIASPAAALGINCRGSAACSSADFPDAARELARYFPLLHPVPCYEM